MCLKLINIDEKLVKALIQSQFPNWSNLDIKPVENMGHDNRTFHLGDKMSVRLPSGKSYSYQSTKEQIWLPFLSDRLSFNIPQIVAVGKESDIYPFTWSVCKWLDGDLPSTNNITDMNLFAYDLASFLKELQSIDCCGGPLAGEHNFHRGGDISVYNLGYLELVDNLCDVIGIDKSLLLEIWNLGLSSKWMKKPVWVHGDLVSTNMLVLDGKLSAVIDFGILGVGDPACDLSMYWTFFDKESREIFKSKLNLDESTWDRARAWVIWKQLFDFQYYITDNSKTSNLKNIIFNLIDEYKQNTSNK